MAKSQAQILERLLEKHSPLVRAAFKAAVKDLRDGIILRDLAEALDRGDVEAAVNALRLEEDAFGRFEQSLLEAYNAGGQGVVDSVPKLRDPNGQAVIFRWGVRNRQAEEELRENAGGLIRGIIQEQRTGIQRELYEGLSRGDNPWETARNIAGRKAVNGSRKGGMLGLTEQQMETTSWVRRAMLNGEREGMKEYLGATEDMLEMPREELKRELKERGLKNRDHRLDGRVLDAIQGKRDMDRDTAHLAADRYSSRTLNWRARTVSRHETMTALAKSRDDAFRQQVEAGKLLPQDVTKTWYHTPRQDPRQQHLALDGRTVRQDEPFVAPDGSRIDYPHSPNAPVGHTIFCMCRTEYEVDFIASAARNYRGQ